MVLLYDPTATREDGLPRKRARLDTLAGKVVGFIDNAKPNFDHLVEDLGRILMAQHGVARVITRRKSSASIPATAETIDELAQQCDLVITGSGD
jgi:hypothetical protein